MKQVYINKELGEVIEFIEKMEVTYSLPDTALRQNALEKNVKSIMEILLLDTQTGKARLKHSDLDKLFGGKDERRGSSTPANHIRNFLLHNRHLLAPSTFDDFVKKLISLKGKIEEMAKTDVLTRLDLTNTSMYSLTQTHPKIEDRKKEERVSEIMSCAKDVLDFRAEKNRGSKDAVHNCYDRFTEAAARLSDKDEWAGLKSEIEKAVGKELNILDIKLIQGDRGKSSHSSEKASDQDVEMIEATMKILVPALGCLQQLQAIGTVDTALQKDAQRAIQEYSAVYERQKAENKEREMSEKREETNKIKRANADWEKTQEEARRKVFEDSKSPSSSVDGALQSSIEGTKKPEAEKPKTEKLQVQSFQLIKKTKQPLLKKESIFSLDEASEKKDTSASKEVRDQNDVGSRDTATQGHPKKVKTASQVGGDLAAGQHVHEVVGSGKFTGSAHNNHMKGQPRDKVEQHEH